MIPSQNGRRGKRLISCEACASEISHSVPAATSGESTFVTTTSACAALPVESPPAPPASPASVGSQPAPATDAPLASSGDPKGDFLAAYRAAFAKHDVDALAQFVRWDSASADFRNILLANLRTDVRMSLAEVDLAPLTAGETAPREIGGTRVAPDLPVVGKTPA